MHIAFFKLFSEPSLSKTISCTHTCVSESYLVIEDSEKPSILLFMRTIVEPLRLIRHQHRSHGSFLCRLKDHLPSRSAFIESILKSAADEGFRLETIDEGVLRTLMDLKHQKSTRVICES